MNVAALAILEPGVLLDASGQLEHDAPEVLRGRIEEISTGDLNAIRLRR